MPLSVVPFRNPVAPLSRFPFLRRGRPPAFAPVLIQFESACWAEHALTVNQTGLSQKR